MNKTTILKNITSMFALLLAGANVNAQFTETMGTTGPSTQTIAAREAAGLFSVAALTYSGVGSDARTTTPSHTGTGGYAGASAGYNVLLQPGNETFEIRTINALSCSGATLSFGINKNTNASTGSELVLEYSVNNGTSWTAIPFAALPTGTGTSGTTWYLRSVLLPAGAVSSLWLRFTNTQAGNSGSNPQFRIDDVSMSCGLTADCSGLNSDVAVFGDQVFCAEEGATDLEASTNMTGATYQWFDQQGEIPGATTEFYTATASGTYYVVISNAEGCEITSEKTYILAYPAPQYCPIALEGCEGDTLDLCPQPKAGDLFFSQYVEGSGLNKYLEIFNGTCLPVDLGDYEVRAYHNGSPVPTFVIPMGTILAAGDVYVIAHTDATAWTTGTPDQFTDSLQFNGDDAIVLYNTAADFIADIFGSVGNDPGSAWRDTSSVSATLGWRTEDKTLVRKSCVYTGITVNPALPGIYGFPTLFTEWDTLPQNAVTGLGSHDFGADSYAFAVTSGSSTIASSNGICAKVVVGRTPSTIEIDGTFCGFNNCADANNIVTVTENCAQPRALKTAAISADMHVQVFPNPASDVTMITFGMENDGMIAVTMTDLAGHVVMSNAIQAVAGEQRIELNLSELSAGTYVLNIATANALETVRIVKTK